MSLAATVMFELKSTPLFPNHFRYYGSTCISLAFPGRTIFPLAKDESLDYCPRLDSTQPDPTPKRVGRNDPCPCGSGKKYKRCCARSSEAALF
jgi:hypothetical protein